MNIKSNEEFVYLSVLNGNLQIRQDGSIWRIRKRGWDRWKNQAVSRPCLQVRAEHDCGDYSQVRAMIDSKRVYCLAHRLVYRHFKGIIPDGMTVNHENGRKKENWPDNLTLATYSEQQIHATQTLRRGHACDQDGMRNSQAKLHPIQVMEIRERRLRGEALLSIAKDFPVGFKAISKIANGERWVLTL